MDNICHFKCEIYLLAVEYLDSLSKQCANSCTEEIIWDGHIHMFCPLESGMAWSHGPSSDKFMDFCNVKGWFPSQHTHTHIYIYI